MQWALDGWVESNRLAPYAVLMGHSRGGSGAYMLADQGEVADAWLHRLDRLDGLDAAQLANNAGLIHEARGDLDEAERWHRRALALREATLDVDHPETGHSHGNLGNVAAARQDYDRALEHHRRALEVREAGLGSDHPDVARSLGNIGRVYVARGDVNSAIEHFDRALAIALPTVGPKHRVVGRVLQSTGDAYRLRGDLERATELYTQALAVQIPELGANHPETAQTRLDLGLVLASSGHDEEAMVQLRGAADAFARLLAVDRPQRVAADRAITDLCARTWVAGC